MNEAIGLKQSDISKWKAVARQDLDYHRRQFENTYRSTVQLGQFISSLIGSTRGEALDVACGAGANILHLAQTMPGFSWTGIDIAGPELFDVGRPLLARGNVEVDLMEGDFYKLTDYFNGQKFSMVLAIQTLSIISSYERILEQLLSVTGGWLFISSLFTDFNVDVNIEVKDYTWPENCQDVYHYNVYSLAKFQATCEAGGCKEFVSRDFEIDIDLPVPASGGFGTYTRKLDDGTRLQFSGPMFQPWKFVGVRMG